MPPGRRTLSTPSSNRPPPDPAGQRRAIARAAARHPTAAPDEQKNRSAPPKSPFSPAMSCPESLGAHSGQPDSPQAQSRGQNKEWSWLQEEHGAAQGRYEKFIRLFELVGVERFFPRPSSRRRCLRRRATYLQLARCSASEAKHEGKHRWPRLACHRSDQGVRELGERLFESVIVVDQRSSMVPRELVSRAFTKPKPGGSRMAVSASMVVFAYGVITPIKPVKAYSRRPPASRWLFLRNSIACRTRWSKKVRAPSGRLRQDPDGTYLAAAGGRNVPGG